ncbi:GPW/gp25 family protein [Halocynthiibacter namhaensis]|uniref:GPW/gp25 family protein n=1 Tax=Halocynthiibacter namhaensis TaxID=1290553 RepID=UPI00057924DA|nr:GPW/gp25 family protein [Halocynthiibacter namhaensis]
MNIAVSTGMDRQTGRRITGDAHLAQSIADILTTPKGTLVMLRDYGSDLPDIIDQPINGETLIDVYQATAEALDRWEPRLKLERVQITQARAGFAELELSAEVTGDSRVLPVAVDLVNNPFNTGGAS